MRTPWRMLSDLMSGKPSKDDAEANAQDNGSDKDEQAAHDDSRADVAAIIQPEANDEITNVTAPEPVVSQQTSRVRAEPSADENVTEIEPGTIADEGHASAALEPVAIVSSRPEAEPAKPVVKRSPVATRIVADPKKPAAARAKKTAPMSALTAPATDVPVAKSVFEEMSVLDHEIDDLRHRLSEKLKLQNAQLRKLIDRYDRR
jgi:hypothetical protein